MNNKPSAEEQRLAAAREGAKQQLSKRTTHWKRWGPYLSERQWGTVREDYSAYGSAWDYFTYDQARSRVYRWGEDGIGGISDNHQRLCFALTLWNEADPFLKERLFGLTASQGNHGEDVKEYYFYLDNTPTHSYMKFLYKYPQRAFPYNQLIEENRARSHHEAEFDLIDTGIFNDDYYFDVFVEYAKASPEDILIQISATNRGPDAKPLHLLPTLWFRNTWSWDPNCSKPNLKRILIPSAEPFFSTIEICHPTLGNLWLYCKTADDNSDDNSVDSNRAAQNNKLASLLFTENETNNERLFGAPNASNYVKDGINDCVVRRQTNAVNPAQSGTKAAAHYQFMIGAGKTQKIQLRLSDRFPLPLAFQVDLSAADSVPSRETFVPFGSEFETIWQRRQQEADEFYQRMTPFPIPENLRQLQRQAFAGLLWSKQFYHYAVENWLKGDRIGPTLAPNRKSDRNCQWVHLFNDDILSVPDKWEYPWFAAWDLAFHVIALAAIDPDFAKRQLDLMTRQWYMHPSGQLPAYEWNFGEVNPPVHAWAVWRVYKIEQKLYGRTDREFLERVFQKLVLNFTWWVNRKDLEGNNIFEGGFVGLDNIGVFDRRIQLPTGGYIEQADGASWIAMYCLNLLAIALELAIENPVYEDMASKFFEHFLYIADAMNHIGPDKTQLWDAEDGFYYDVLHLSDGQPIPLKVRSMVGLIPLLAVATLEPDRLNSLPNFKKRLEWFVRHRSDLRQNVACLETEGIACRRLLALCCVTPGRLVPEDKLRCILSKLLDESEFLSEFGIRSLSKFHAEHPYCLKLGNREHQVCYEPAESSSEMFGGNSNWRGPIWFPINYLIVEALQKFHYYLGDTFKVECPTGSGQWLTLWQIAAEISQRLIRIFVPDESGQRPVYGNTERFQTDPHWRDLILFYEYFHGDTGTGMGASHQTGWTGLVTKLIQQHSEYAAQHKTPELTRKIEEVAEESSKKNF